MGQRLGHCQNCGNPRAQMVYVVLHPVTGRKLTCCRACEAAFAAMREAPQADYEEAWHAASALLAVRA